MTAPLFLQNNFLRSAQMGPLRSGIFEMITVSVGSGACMLLSASFRVVALCAAATDTEEAMSERLSSAKPASGTARREDLTVAWRPWSTGCADVCKEKADTRRNADP